MLGRLFCFNGGRGADWAAHGQYGELARARVLEVVEEELEERYTALAHPPPPPDRASQDALHLRRLYKANLPSSEMSLCKELLRKLAAIDGAREAAEADQRRLQSQVKAAEVAHRQAEFARARAEAIATARGEALMHAQQATRDAEMQHVQLAEMLKQALPQLGIDISPLMLNHTHSPLPVPPAGNGDDNVTPLPRPSCMFSQQQLAAVAASISRLPPQSQAGSLALVPPQEQQRRGIEGACAHSWDLEQQQLLLQAQDVHREERRRSRRDSGQSSQGQERQAPQLPLAADNEEAPQLSGFTVYTNGLQSPEFAEQGEGEVAQPWQQPPAAQPSPLDSQSSGVAWRSISSAAVSSQSAGCAGEEGSAEKALQLGALQEQAQQQALGSGAHRQSRCSHAGSRDSSLHQQQRGSAGSLEGAATAEDWDQPGNKLQQCAQHLPMLVLPGLDASQLDSLVRIGASMQSPDPYAAHVAAEMLQQLPPGWEQAATGQWDSSANPLQSQAGLEQYLAELRAEAQRQGMLPPADGHRSHSGSSRASFEGMPGAAPTEQARTGSEVPALHRLYAEASKYPGAGTWVSPSLAAMIAHKKGHNPFLEGGEPSPPSHIKAVLGTTEDREFYGPMAAHLTKRELRQGNVVRAPAPPLSRHQPHAASDSIHGPQRQVSSNRSSMDGSAQRDRRQQQQAAQQAEPHQPVAGSRAALQQSIAVAVAAPGVGSRGSSRNVSRNASRTASPQRQQQQLPQQPPERRQAAFLNRFQPMGMYAQQSVEPALLHQQQQQLVAAPRHSSVALSRLGISSQRRSSASADENLAAVALSKSSLRGCGLPPCQQQQQQALPAVQPATKRSLDSMRDSIGGRVAAANISTSIHAVEAAMAALRDANPHLRGAPPTTQQQQQQALVQQGATSSDSGRPTAGVPHHHTCSLPDASEPDLPLHALSTSVEQQGREQQNTAATGAGGAHSRRVSKAARY